MTASEVFAAHAATLAWRGLPAHVRDAAGIFLLDTLAVGAAGAAALFAGEVLRLEAAGARGDAVILGSGATLAPRAAAFVNAYQIHAQEFDCVHEPAVLHPCSAVLGALVAECGGGGTVDGETFLAALVAGVDISVSLGLAARGPLTFFRPASAGIFGATAAVCRVRGLSQAQIVSALGHALCFASGTMQAHVEGTPGLALQVAAAAANAIRAADLAQAGVPGALGAVDGPFGYLALFETASDLAPVLARLGQDFAIAALSHKPFPTGRAAHGGIFAVRTLMHTHGVRPGDVATLTYEAPSLIARLVGRPAHPGMRIAYARLCLPYLAARTLLYGTAGLEAFAPEALSDDAVLGLAGRINVTVDNNPDVAAFTPARLVAALRDGSEIIIDVPALPGSPALPLDDADRLGKVQDCLDFAGLSLSAAGLAAQVAAAESMPDVRALFGLLRTSPEATLELP